MNGSLKPDVNGFLKPEVSEFFKLEETTSLKRKYVNFDTGHHKYHRGIKDKESGFVVKASDHGTAQGHFCFSLLTRIVLGNDETECYWDASLL